MSLVLALETSCDETSAAVVDGGRRVVSSIVSSQVDLHRRYGGVVPEFASRRHLEAFLPVVDQALAEAGVWPADLDAVAVTVGPGLVGALVVGLAAASGLALAWNKPLVPCNHLAAHAYAVFLGDSEAEPPLVALIVSGGHTSLALLSRHVEFRLLGETRDDAAGEAFDKVARHLGLGYPGGPAIDRLARDGDPQAVPFPRALLEPGSLDFSFSGLKTAVLYYARAAAERGEEPNLKDIAASFQAAVVDVLVEKAFQAVRQAGLSRLAVAGGVASNSALRAALSARAEAEGVSLLLPRAEFCTDNAAMVAGLAHFLLADGAVVTPAPGQGQLRAEPALTLEGGRKTKGRRAGSRPNRR